MIDSDVFVSYTKMLTKLIFVVLTSMSAQLLLTNVLGLSLVFAVVATTPLVAALIFALDPFKT